MGFPVEAFQADNQSIVELSNWFKAKKMDRVARKFMAEKRDWNAESLRDFAQKNNLSLEEMRDMILLVKSFRSIADRSDPGFGPLQSDPRIGIYQENQKTGEIKVIVPAKEPKAGKTAWLKAKAGPGAPQQYPEEEAARLIQENPNLYEAVESPLKPKAPEQWKPMTKEEQLAFAKEKARATRAPEKPLDVRVREKKALTRAQKEVESEFKDEDLQAEQAIYDDIVSLFRGAFDSSTPQGQNRIAKAQKYAVDEWKQTGDRAQAILNAYMKTMSEEKASELDEPPGKAFFGMNKSAAKNWAKRAKSAGYDAAQIKEALVGAGWDDGEAEKIIKEAGIPASETSGLGMESPSPKGERKVVRTGTHKGRKVVQYSDGSIEYAD